MCLAGDLGVLLSHALGRVDHDDAHIRALDRKQRTHDRVFLDLFVYLALFADARGIDKGEFSVRIIQIGVHAVARRACDV